MDISILKIFMIFGIVSKWAAKALADGKVSIREAAELGAAVCLALGVTMEVEVPGIEIEPGSEFEAHPGPVEDEAASRIKPVEE